MRATPAPLTVLFAVLPVVLSSPGYSAEPPVTAAAFAPDGTAIVVGSQSGIEVRTWPALERSRTLATRLEHVHQLALSPDGKTLAAAGGSPREAGEIELFDWPAGTSRWRKHLHDDLVYCIAWSDDGGRLATASADSLVRVLDASGKELRALRGHSRGVLAVAWLPGGKQLVSAGIDQSLRLWDVGTGTLVRTLDNHTAAVRGLAVRPAADGPLPMVASAGADRTVRLWQPTIGRLVRFARLPEEPLAIDWTPDGDRLLAACVDGRLRVIDPDTVEIVQDTQAVDGWAYTLVAAPAGKSVFVAGAGGRMKRIPLERGPRATDQ